MQTTPLLRGQCQCGTVHYQVEDSFEYALNCHCSQCRRATGAAFKTFAGIPRQRLQLIQGNGSLLIVGQPESAHDVRCKHCGSLLYSIVREGAYAHVTLGTLTDTPSIRPSAHIFVGSKAPWFTITDDLPQHDEFG